MSSGVFFNVSVCVLSAICLVCCAQVGESSDISPLSASYAIVHRAGEGPEMTIRMRVHLVNSGASRLSIQRIALRDFAHSTRDQVRNCSFTLSPRSSVDTTQEFSVRRLAYDRWRRGEAPKVAVELMTTSGRKTTQILRLSADKGKAE